jgi:hypothetical protein
VSGSPWIVGLAALSGALGMWLLLPRDGGRSAGALLITIPLAVEIMLLGLLALMAVLLI